MHQYVDGYILSNLFVYLCHLGLWLVVLVDQDLNGKCINIGIAGLFRRPMSPYSKILCKQNHNIVQSNTKNFNWISKHESFTLGKVVLVNVMLTNTNSYLKKNMDLLRVNEIQYFIILLICLQFCTSLLKVLRRLLSLWF